jgi:AbrB family transcriptional regulator (stage V sporulation protein T)|nr:MAG TPA: stage V sporulation protein T [Caudoviricetes sp.]
MLYYHCSKGNRKKEEKMRATGIVRRLDDLGRWAIPKEIRRVLSWKEGDPLELYFDKENKTIVLKKYETEEEE